MSKKGIVIGAVVVAAGLSITPYFIGSQTESAIQDQVALFDSSQPVYQARVVRYDRGWLSSNALIEVGVDLNALGFSDEVEARMATSEFQLSLQHGPILTDQGLSLGLASWQLTNVGQGLEDYVQWDKEQPLYLQQGSVNLAGKATYHDVMPQLNNNTNTGEVSFALAEYVGQGSYDGENFTYNGLFSDLVLSVESVMLELRNAKLGMSANATIETMLRGEFYEGTGELTFDSLVVTTAEVGEVVGVNELAMDYITSVTNETNAETTLAHMSMNYAATSLRINGVEAENLRFNTAINNIEKSFLDSYLEQMRNSYDGDPQQFSAMMSELFQAQGLALLQAEPELAITEFSGILPQGEFHANAEMSVAGVTALPQSFGDNVFWREHMRVNSYATVAKPLLQWAAKSYVYMSLVKTRQASELTAEELEQIAAQQTAMMIEASIEQGMLREEDDNYVFDLTVADGVVTINGQSTPLNQAMAGK
ncbi:YdgA family protein [Pseudidiomarina sp. E22-M8]|uniref:YdgA family protein n=1 Tax=Pseudidiomarina sp. E22-M8 TaxID=3424768 RepID=UPI00403C61C4